MAYAVIQTGGKQFRVTEGEVVEVPTLSVEKDSKVQFDVLLKNDGETTEVGSPVLDSKVEATVIDHGRGLKVIVFKKKRRKQYKKKHGHRQNYTKVRIDSI